MHINPLETSFVDIMIWLKMCPHDVSEVDNNQSTKTNDEQNPKIRYLEFHYIGLIEKKGWINITLANSEWSWWDVASVLFSLQILFKSINETNPIQKFDCMVKWRHAAKITILYECISHEMIVLSCNCALTHVTCLG